MPPAPEGGASYAMRFVAGQSLHEAVLAFHAGLKNRQPERAVHFRETVRDQQAAKAYRLGLRTPPGQFVAGCNAMAFAHSRGRDAPRPEAGERHARQRTARPWSWTGAWPESSAAARIRRTRTIGPEPLTRLGGRLDTRPGRPLGTPAYMSPEQATATSDQLGPASDVYSLGATLYCLLTGRPPLVGGGLDQILARCERGDFPKPRAGQPT